MRLYVEVARRTYARTSTYRSATVAGVFTNTVFGFLLAYVLRAVYEQRPSSVPSTSPTRSRSPSWPRACSCRSGLFSTTEIADRIKTGDVIVDLQRPFDHQAWWAAVEYGKAGFYLLFRGIPRSSPARSSSTCSLPSAPTFLAFLVAVGLAIGISFAWRYLLQLTAFWLLDVRGPQPARAPHRPLPVRRVRADRVLPGVARDALSHPAVRLDAAGPDRGVARASTAGSTCCWCTPRRWPGSSGWS